jgi:nitrate reductase gamma subunit
MGVLSLVYVGLSYLCAAIFFGGLAYRLVGYASTPSPLKIPVTPQPVSAIGVLKKIAVNVALFRSLFRGNKWTWLGGYALHLIFIFIFLRHLRFFINPVPAFLADIQQVALLFAALLPAPLVYLMVRRVSVDRYRHISSVADHFALAILLLIGLSGLFLKFVSHGDVVSIKEFLMGLVLFSPVEIPAHSAFLIHYSLVLLFVIYFPFSKLIHSGGIFFSPTVTQADDARENRHINAWGENK